MQGLKHRQKVKSLQKEEEEKEEKEETQFPNSDPSYSKKE